MNQSIEITKTVPQGSDVDAPSQQPGKPPTTPTSSHSQVDSLASTSATSSASAGSGGGLFKSWFPGWSGWYQSAPAPAAKSTAAPPSISTAAPIQQDAHLSSGEPCVTSYDEEVEIGKLFFLDFNFYFCCLSVSLHLSLSFSLSLFFFFRLFLDLLFVLDTCIEEEYDFKF